MSRWLFLIMCVVGSAFFLITHVQAEATSSALNVRTKTGQCISVNGLPDPACTPGDIFSEAAKDEICQYGYSKAVRNVTIETKHEVYASYGIAAHAPGEYEIDHLIPLELGGSNDIANLWPQPALPVPGFHEKDLLENDLHDRMCAGTIDLAEAQHEIASDWLSAYRQMTGQTAVMDWQKTVQAVWAQLEQQGQAVYDQFLTTWKALEQRLIEGLIKRVETRIKASL